MVVPALGGGKAGPPQLRAVMRDYYLETLTEGVQGYQAQVTGCIVRFAEKVGRQAGMSGVPLPVLLVTGVPVVDVGLLEKGCGVGEGGERVPDIEEGVAEGSGAGAGVGMGGGGRDLFLYEGTGCAECQHIAEELPKLVGRRSGRPATCAVIVTTEVAPTSYLAEVLNTAYKVHFRVEQHEVRLSVAGLANHLVCEYLDPSFPYVPGDQFIVTLRQLCRTRSLAVLLHFVEKCLSLTDMSEAGQVLRWCSGVGGATPSPPLPLVLHPKPDVTHPTTGSISTSTSTAGDGVREEAALRGVGAEAFFAERRAEALSVVAAAVEHQDRHGTDMERETLAEVCVEMWRHYSRSGRVTDNHVDMFLQACGRGCVQGEGARRALLGLNGAGTPTFLLQAEDGTPLPRNVWVTPPAGAEEGRRPYDFMNDVLWCLRKAKEPVPAAALVKRVEKLTAGFATLAARAVAAKGMRRQQHERGDTAAQVNRAIHDLVAFDILDLVEGGYLPSVQIVAKDEKAMTGSAATTVAADGAISGEQDLLESYDAAVHAKVPPHLKAGIEQTVSPAPLHTELQSSEDDGCNKAMDAGDKVSGVVAAQSGVRRITSLAEMGQQKAKVKGQQQHRHGTAVTKGTATAAGAKKRWAQEGGAATGTKKEGRESMWGVEVKSSKVAGVEAVVEEGDEDAASADVNSAAELVKQASDDDANCSLNESNSTTSGNGEGDDEDRAEANILDLSEDSLREPQYSSGQCTESSSSGDTSSSSSEPKPKPKQKQKQKQKPKQKPGRKRKHNEEDPVKMGHNELDEEEEEGRSLPRKAGSRKSMPTTTAGDAGVQSQSPVKKKRKVRGSQSQSESESRSQTSGEQTAATSRSDFSNVSLVTKRPLGTYTNPGVEENTVDSDLLQASLRLIQAEAGQKVALSEWVDAKGKKLGAVMEKRKAEKEYYRWLDWEQAEGGWFLSSFVLEQVRRSLVKSRAGEEEVLGRAMLGVKAEACSGLLLGSKSLKGTLESLGWVKDVDTSTEEWSAYSAVELFRQVHLELVKVSQSEQSSSLYYDPKVAKRYGDLDSFAKCHFSLHGKATTKASVGTLRTKVKDFIPFPQWVRGDVVGSMVIEAFRRALHTKCLTAYTGHAVLDSIFLAKASKAPHSRAMSSNVLCPSNRVCILKYVVWAERPQVVASDGGTDAGDMGSSYAHDKTEGSSNADFDDHR